MPTGVTTATPRGARTRQKPASLHGEWYHCEMRLLLLAIMIAAVQGCGDNIHFALTDAGSGTDASAGDASAGDASFVDGGGGDSGMTPTTITVTVYGDGTDAPAGQLVPNTKVYFTALDGTVTSTTTDANGVATATLPAATAIVARNYNATNWSLTGFVGLVAGDSIVIGFTSPTSFSSLGAITFDLPTDASATSYQMITSCSNGGVGASSPISVTVTACPDQMSASAVVVALDAGGAPVGYSSMTGLALPSLVNTIVTMPAYQGTTTVNGAFTNLPAATTNLQWTTNYRKGTDPVVYGSSIVSSPVASTALNLSASIIGFGDRSHFSVKLTETGSAVVAFIQEPTTIVSSFQLDASSTIHGATAAHYDQAHQTIAWTESATGADANFVDAALAWIHSGILVRYEFVAPRDASGASAAIPQLPAELSAIAYAPAEASYNGLTLGLYLGYLYHDVLVATDRSTFTRWVTSL